MSPVETKRQPCEVYSRVCGYLRPVSQWNDSKQAEFASRKMYKTENSEK
ncbi:MAG: anaerobic ribonucleoside-triphosphate reductase [Patescibacteria group bacterium]|jgi:ribonucleoside-triphosphate reductase